MCFCFLPVLYFCLENIIYLLIVLPRYVGVVVLVLVTSLLDNLLYDLLGSSCST